MSGSGGGLARRWNALPAPIRIAVAAGSTLVTAATIAIPIVAGVIARPTSTQTVTVGSTAPSATHAPERAPVVQFDAASDAGLAAAMVPESMEGQGSLYPRWWLLPADAPIETFPPSDGTRTPCTTLQHLWLAEHAIDPRGVTDRVQSVDVRNDATSGSNMTVTNFRTDGDLTHQGVPMIVVNCSWSGAAGGPQIINLSFDGQPGVWGETSSQTDGQIQPAGTIASVDLAAGELANLVFRFPDDQGVFEGRVLADIVVGAESRTVMLLNDIWILPRPSEELGFEGFSEVPGTLSCSVGIWPDTQTNACTPTDAQSLARALQ